MNTFPSAFKAFLESVPIKLTISSSVNAPAVYVAALESSTCANSPSPIIGIPEKNDLEVEANEFLFYQKTYRGSLGATYPEEDFPYFLDMYHKGKFPINEMISETFSLNQINEACDKLHNGQIAGRSIIKY